MDVSTRDLRLRHIKTFIETNLKVNNLNDIFAEALPKGRQVHRLGSGRDASKLRNYSKPGLDAFWKAGSSYTLHAMPKLDDLTIVHCIGWCCTGEGTYRVTWAQQRRPLHRSFRTRIVSLLRQGVSGVYRSCLKSLPAAHWVAQCIIWKSRELVVSARGHGWRRVGNPASSRRRRWATHTPRCSLPRACPRHRSASARGRHTHRNGAGGNGIEWT